MIIIKKIVKRITAFLFDPSSFIKNKEKLKALPSPPNNIPNGISIKLKEKHGVVNIKHAKVSINVRMLTFLIIEYCLNLHFIN